MFRYLFLSNFNSHSILISFSSICCELIFFSFLLRVKLCMLNITLFDVRESETHNSCRDNHNNKINNIRRCNVSRYTTVSINSFKRLVQLCDPSFLFLRLPLWLINTFPDCLPFPSDSMCNID